MSDNKYYDKIRKYAQRALHSDLKTYIRGRSKYMYGTVDMSEYVKQEVFDETVEELEDKILDLDDKKADKSDVYTKEETDDKFLTKDEAAATYQPIGDYATITYVDNADKILLNQINLKLDQLTAGLGIVIENNVISCTIDTTLYKVVTSLPDKPDDEDKNKIFLVPSELQGDKNIYIEYIYVDGAWEKIGEIQTEVDLSNYYTKDQIDNLLSNKQDTLIAGDNITIVDNVISSTGSGGGGGITKVTASGTSPLTLNASVSGSTAAITGFVDTYSKSEIDDLIANIDLNIEITNEYTIDLYDSVFVVCTRSSVEGYHLARPSAIKEGGFTNYTWEGIAVVENGKIFIIALNNSPKQLPISSSVKLFGTAKALAEAVVDQDGAGNTNLILQASSDECITNTSDYAAGYCNAYETSAFPAGSWYLPSFYEFLIIKKYLREINYALSLVGGDPIIYENVPGAGYWTSTEMDANNAWVLNTYETYLTAGNKSELSRNVRPVTMFGHVNDVEPPEPVTVTYDIEITNYAYSNQSHTYEALSVNVSSLTVVLYTYENGVLVSTTDVTNNCDYEVIPNVDWITLPVLKSGLATINLTENTSTEQREGTVHLIATYQSIYTAEADSNIILQGGKSVEYNYSLEVSTFNYTTSAGTNIIPASGGTFSPTLTTVLYTTNLDTGLTTSEIVTPDSILCTIERNDFASMNREDTGLYTWSKNTTSGSRNVVISVIAYYTAPNSKELTAETGCTVYQDSAETVITYSLEVEDFYYNNKNNIPASGGTYTPTLSINLVGSDGSSKAITIPEDNCAYNISSQMISNYNTHTGVITINENVSTSTRSAIMYFDGIYTDPNGDNLKVSTNYTIVLEAADDNPNSPETYHLAEGTLIINSEASNLNASDIQLENVAVSINSSNYTGTGLADVIRYRPMGESELLIGSFGSSIPLLPTSDDIELTKVAKLSMVGIAFEDPTLNLDTKQIKYTFKWHYDNGKTFERSGNLYLENRGMGDAGEWITDDYDQSDANLYYNSDYEMYPEVTLTITD